MQDPPRPDRRPVSPDPARAIVVSATFTAEALDPSLNFWLHELGWDYQVRFAPYNQVFQQLLDPASLLARTRNGVCVVMVRWEDWARCRDGAAPDLAELERNTRHFAAALRDAAAVFSSPLVVVLCPASPRFPADAARRMEALVGEGAASLPAVHLIAPGEIDRLYPVTCLHDPHADELGHIPYTPEFFAALATVIARKIHALRGTPYKVIALDCDETLWRGICGEDGPQGVEVDAPRRALQEFMAAQRAAGMLLCLCSKNNEEDVLETFEAHPEMPLKIGDFAARRINWDSKALNLSELAAELSLGLASFIFVDDNPKECTEVEAHCPDVLALALPPRAEDIPAFLEHVWAFDHARVTEEDRRRAAMYAQQAERARLERQSASFEEFLASLKLEVRIAPAAADQIPRVAQLTQRTNQMNATTLRRTESEVREALAAGAGCLAVEVSDRFGSYGLTGVAIFREAERALAVDTFLLSCRALGRGVEHRMIAALGEAARARSLEAVEIPFVASQRNRPALLFLESVGAGFAQPAADGRRVFRFPAACAAEVVYKPAAPVPRPAAAAPREGGPRAETLDYARIAGELRCPKAVLARLPNGAKVAAGYRPSTPPRTELEQKLAAIWKELLNVAAIGVDDNFFDLGGHSLLAVQLLSRVRRELGAELSLEVVYGGDFTIAALARAMEVKQIEEAAPEEYDGLLRELEGLSDEEVRALLAEEDAAS